ncbi:unnamed protein product, partial [Meganyctiphanes norvegica]
IYISSEISVKCVPKISYTGDVFSVSLVCDIKDDFGSWVACVLKNLCPATRNGEITSLSLQDTHLTDLGIGKVLAAMHKNGISVRRLMKISTTAQISYSKREELKQLAKHRSVAELH